jgi:hypothetical protein
MGPNVSADTNILQDKDEAVLIEANANNLVDELRNNTVRDQDKCLPGGQVPSEDLKQPETWLLPNDLTMIRCTALASELSGA